MRGDKQGGNFGLRRVGGRNDGCRLSIMHSVLIEPRHGCAEQREDSEECRAKEKRTASTHAGVDRARGMSERGWRRDGDRLTVNKKEEGGKEWGEWVS